MVDVAENKTTESTAIFDATQVMVLKADMSRITSYNVCYTKLLRSRCWKPDFLNITVITTNKECFIMAGKYSKEIMPEDVKARLEMGEKLGILSYNFV